MSRATQPGQQAAPPDATGPDEAATIAVSSEAAMRLRLLALNRALATGGRPSVPRVVDDMLAAYGDLDRLIAEASNRRRSASFRFALLAACVLFGAWAALALWPGPERPAPRDDAPLRRPPPGAAIEAPDPAVPAATEAPPEERRRQTTAVEIEPAGASEGRRRSPMAEADDQAPASRRASSDAPGRTGPAAGAEAPGQDRLVCVYRGSATVACTSFD